MRWRPLRLWFFVIVASFFAALALTAHFYAQTWPEMVDDAGMVWSHAWPQLPEDLQVSWDGSTLTATPSAFSISMPPKWRGQALPTNLVSFDTSATFSASPSSLFTVTSIDVAMHRHGEQAVRQPLPAIDYETGMLSKDDLGRLVQELDEYQTDLRWLATGIMGIFYLLSTFLVRFVVLWIYVWLIHHLLHWLGAKLTYWQVFKLGALMLPLTWLVHTMLLWLPFPTVAFEFWLLWIILMALVARVEGQLLNTARQK